MFFRCGATQQLDSLVPGRLQRHSLRASSSRSSILPSLGIAVLPSDLSLAALLISFSALNLDLHCAEDIDELNPEPSSLDC